MLQSCESPFSCFSTSTRWYSQPGRHLLFLQCQLCIILTHFLFDPAVLADTVVTFSAGSALGYQEVIGCDFDIGLMLNIYSAVVRRDFIHLFREGAPWKINWPLLTNTRSICRLQKASINQSGPEAPVNCVIWKAELSCLPSVLLGTTGSCHSRSRS